MRKSLRLPAVRCDNCGGDLTLVVDTSGLKLSSLRANCASCGHSIDLFAEVRGQAARSNSKLKSLSREVAGAIREARTHVPKDREELRQAIQNPKHPFTAAVLTGLVLVAMELSGFGIFMALPWILGNLILNPIGWVLIPVVVAVAIAYRSKLKSERLAELRTRLDDLQRQRDDGVLTQEQFETARDEAIQRLLE